MRPCASATLSKQRNGIAANFATGSRLSTSRVNSLIILGSRNHPTSRISISQGILNSQTVIYKRKLNPRRFGSPLFLQQKRIF